MMTHRQMMVVLFVALAVGGAVMGMEIHRLRMANTQLSGMQREAAAAISNFTNAFSANAEQLRQNAAEMSQLRAELAQLRGQKEETRALQESVKKLAAEI